MLASERMLYILEELKISESVKLKNICAALQTSESTIRRDLEELEKQNKLKRVHGGAIRVSLNSILNETKELSMHTKKDLHKEEKLKLCQMCASIVEDGDCIFVDGGTTFLQLMPLLEGKRIKVVTHSDFVRSEAQGIEVIVIGGRNLGIHKMNVGPMALEQLSKFSFDKAFIGCAGVTLNTNEAFTAEMDSAQIKKIAIQKSNQTYLLIDQSKLNRKGFYSFANVKQFTSILLTKNNEIKDVPSNFIFV